jgi:hypothetical protein
LWKEESFLLYACGENVTRDLIGAECQQFQEKILHHEEDFFREARTFTTLGIVAGIDCEERQGAESINDILKKNPPS